MAACAPLNLGLNAVNSAYKVESVGTEEIASTYRKFDFIVG